MSISYQATIVEVAREYQSLPRGGKTKYLQEVAETLNCSYDKLLKELRKVAGWNSGRKTRCDKGSTKVDAAALEFVGTLGREGIRKNGKSTMAVTTALGIAQANGHMPGVSSGRFREVLKARRMDRESQTQNKPHKTMRAEHPNHVHQVDPSLCVVYYVNGEQKIIKDEEFYKNKLGNVAKLQWKCWRYVLWDAASSAIKVRYVEAAGESQHNLLDFLLWAWSDTEQQVPYGAPRMLYMDPGSAPSAFSIKTLCEAMGVKVENHMPGVARATGGVESAQNIVETQFESRLRTEPVSSCEALNRAAQAWSVAWNADEIPGQDCRLKRRGVVVGTRRNLWMLITQDELRCLPPPEVCRALAVGKPQERKVKQGLHISYAHPMAKRTRYYPVRGLDGVNVGDTVTVHPMVYPLDAHAIRIKLPRYDGADLVYDVLPEADLDRFGQPLDADVWGGVYRSLPATDADRVGKRLDQLAYPGMNQEEIRKARAKNATPMLKPDGTTIHAHSYLADVKVTTALPRRGETIDVPDYATPAPVAPLTHFAACKRIAAQLGRALSPDENAQVRAWYPEGVPEDSLPMVATCVANGTTPFNAQRAPLRAAG